MGPFRTPLEKRLRLDDRDRLILLESLLLYCHEYPEEWEARQLALAVMKGRPGRRAQPYSVQLYTIKEWISDLRKRTSPRTFFS